MAKDSTNLLAARQNKNDEFYTQRADIERELNNYNHLSRNNQFRDKIVYCNCDDPDWSNFTKYFADNFSALGLKKLICTHFEPDPNKKSYLLTITRGQDKNNDGKINRNDIEKIDMLFSNGDFRSEECIKLLDESDIVCTNPPFSLFREYVAQLIEHKKKFLIIGSKNSVSYKDIFKLIMENKLWLGAGFNGGNAYFGIPKENAREFANGVYDPEKGVVKFRNVGWFTNMDFDKRHDEFIPKNYKTYKGNERDYPKYDKYDAINVNTSADIPIDYMGLMGVPITFLDKWNPDQFEILGDSRYHDGKDEADDINIVNGKLLYRRILIKRKDV